MRTRITSGEGVVTEVVGAGVVLDTPLSIGGTDGQEYPFNGRWDDLQGTMHGASATGQAGLTYEQYRNTPIRLYFFQHNQTDELGFVFQLTHTWDPETAVEPHLHLVPMTTGSGDAYFAVDTTWAVFDSELMASGSWESRYFTFTMSGSMGYKHKALSLGNYNPPADARASSMFIMRVRRLGDHVLDTYTQPKDHGTSAANPGILYCDVHYRRKRAGTVNQYGPT